MKITWPAQLGRTRVTVNGVADGVGHELAAVLVPLRKRALADSAIRWALRALGGWAVATAGLLTWSKFQLITDVPLVTLSLGPLAALLALGGWLAHRPTTPEVARVADARLDLKERLSSALCFIGSQDEMAELLRADAVACAREHQPRDAYPVSAHRRLAAVVLAAVLAVGVLLASPDPQAGALARRVADQAALAEARKAVASASRGLGKPSSAQARRLAGALQGALVGLGRARGPLSGLVVLSSLQAELSALGSRSGPVVEGAAAAAGGAMVGAPGAGPVWQSLAEGDLGAAASALRALAVRLPNLTPAQREALATALANAGSAAARAAGPPRGSTQAGAGGTDAGLARGLSRAARALAAGQTGAAGQALAEASNSTKALAAAASLEETAQSRSGRCPRS